MSIDLTIDLFTIDKIDNILDLVTILRDDKNGITDWFLTTACSNSLIFPSMIRLINIL